jgi:hypothetical protein
MAILLKLLAFFGTKTGMLVGAVVAVMASYATTFYKGKSYGYGICKAEWSATELAAIEKSRRARVDAERDVSGGLPNDPDRRD